MSIVDFNRTFKSNEWVNIKIIAPIILTLLFALGFTPYIAGGGLYDFDFEKKIFPVSGMAMFYIPPTDKHTKEKLRKIRDQLDYFNR